MSRSNLFANIENKFELSDTEGISNLTLQAFTELVYLLKNELNQNALFSLLLIGAKLGVANDSGELNDREKELVDHTFGKVVHSDIEQVYSLIAEGLDGSEYGFVQNLTRLGNDIALPYLHFILGFAYIDEKVNDEVLDKLDGLFGMNLLTTFFQSDMEEVPAPRVKLSELEAKIVKVLKDKEELLTLDQISKNVTGSSQSEVKEAIDNLCDKGVVFGTNTIVGFLYGLC